MPPVAKRESTTVTPSTSAAAARAVSHVPLNSALRCTE